MTSTKINTISGFDVYVTHYGRFHVTLEDTKYEKDTMDEIKELIDKHVKAKRSFKAIDCISLRDHELSRITSRDPDSKNYYRITHEGRGDKKDLGKRPLVRRTYDGIEPYYYLRTTENMEVIKAIWELDDQIAGIRKIIDGLETKLQDPVTPEYIDAMIGGD